MTIPSLLRALIRFVFRFVRTKRIKNHFVLCATKRAQNETSTPGFVSFCAPPKGARTKRNQTESGVRRREGKNTPQATNKATQHGKRIPVFAGKTSRLAQVAFFATSWLPGRPRFRSPVIGQMYEPVQNGKCRLVREEFCRVSFCVSCCAQNETQNETNPRPCVRQPATDTLRPDASSKRPKNVRSPHHPDAPRWRRFEHLLSGRATLRPSVHTQTWRKSPQNGLKCPVLREFLPQARPGSFLGDQTADAGGMDHQRSFCLFGIANTVNNSERNP